jgi:hypothetical protein
MAAEVGVSTDGFSIFSEPPEPRREQRNDDFSWNHETFGRFDEQEVG